MTSAAGEKFAPHEGHAAHRRGGRKVYAGDAGGEAAGRIGAAHAAHRYVRAQGPPRGAEPDADDRRLDDPVQLEEPGSLAHPGPENAGAPRRREGAGPGEPKVEARNPRGGGRDRAGQRRLQIPVGVTDEAEREVQLLDGYGPYAVQGTQALRRGRDAPADGRRQAHRDEQPRPRRGRAVSCGAAHTGTDPAVPIPAAMILLIDNYDSFAFNLARYLEELGETVRVRRNDEVDPASVAGDAPSHIVISPGPCTPAEAGASVEVVRVLGASIPILGVCLGHQCIAAATGGRVARAARPMHGRLSAIRHAGRGLFASLPSPLEVTRYHSLVVDPADPGSGLRVTAETAAGEVMAVEHASWPVWGVQFHPEAVLTAGGHRLLANFLALGRGDVPASEPVRAERCPELPTGAPSP